MRILHFQYIPRLSGAESLATELALRHTRLGHEVAVAAFAPPESSFQGALERLRHEQVTAVFPNAPLRGPARLLWVRKVCARLGPDVVAAHSVIPSAYVRLALLAQRSPAVVSVLHSATQDDYREWRFRIPEFLLQRRAAAVVTVSPNAGRRYVSRVGGEAVVQTILNGIDVDRIRAAAPARDAWRTQLRTPAGARVVLQIGRFASVKNQDATITAFAHMRKRGFNTLLWLAGVEEDDAYLARLRALSRSLGVDGNVLFLGPRYDIPELLAAADVYAMPSRDEGHSVAMLEALASGIPVVAAPIRAFDFVRSHPAATLVDPDQSLAYADALEQAAKTERTTRDVSGYSIERTSAEYLHLFAKVTSTLSS